MTVANVSFQLIEDISKELEIQRMEKMRAMNALQNCKEFPSQIETELQIQLDSLKEEHRSELARLCIPKINFTVKISLNNVF